MPRGVLGPHASCKGHTKRAPPFGEWAVNVLAKAVDSLRSAGLETPLETTPAPDLERYFSANQARLRQVFALDTIAACLRPVGEAVIVADRVAYLTEQGHPARAAAMFDPNISARNWVVVAAKPPWPGQGEGQGP